MFLCISFILTVVTYTSYLSALVFLLCYLLSLGLSVIVICVCAYSWRGGDWIIHNILLWTPVGNLLELVFVTSGIIGYYRHYIFAEGELNNRY